MPQYTQLFEDTNAQITSLASHDHLNALFNYLMDHQLADDIKYCTQQVVGDLILLNSASNKFSIPQAIAVKTINDFTNYFTEQFGKMCDINADTCFEHGVQEGCNMMNRALNNWLMSLRTSYNKNIIPVLAPTCIDIKLPIETMLENSDQLAKIYKEYCANAMKLLKDAYMNKYNALYETSKTNTHNALCEIYAKFTTEEIVGQLSQKDMGHIRKEVYKLPNLLENKVLLRSFSTSAVDGNEEIFRSTYVLQKLTTT